MSSQPYKDARVQQANDNLRVLYGALENGDLKTFGEIIENEAMSLHALMLSSYPSFCLLHPNTLKIINLIKNYRKETDANLYYTIDAGPNIHLIYPALEKNEIEQFIHNKLESSCESIIYGESLGT